MLLIMSRSLWPRGDNRRGIRMKRNFTVRMNGVEMTTLRPSVHLTKEDWENLCTLAKRDGLSPEQWVDAYVSNMTDRMYDALAFGDGPKRGGD